MPYRDAITKDGLRYRTGNFSSKNSGIMPDRSSDFFGESCKCLILPFPIPESPTLSRQQEMNALQKDAEYLENILDNIHNRIRFLKVKEIQENELPAFIPKCAFIADDKIKEIPAFIPECVSDTEKETDELPYPVHFYW